MEKVGIQCAYQKAATENGAARPASGRFAQGSQEGSEADSLLLAVLGGQMEDCQVNVSAGGLGRRPEF